MYTVIPNLGVNSDNLRIHGLSQTIFKILVAENGKSQNKDFP